ncbi:bleomycin resistance protein [Rhizobium viscosum]|uniref:Bleomycin resistance protein n=1 Tax=Rhizobium viscosum TaxID=1673 RepID=A0ABR9IMA5_RHIVS|nr:VOC family protein [Rhizobium viscosum]MBE1504312.1 catechol 2,3-dioxygenase-like lactoylglutathione lyase family enzyme [Rhizobium viscosum]
MPNFENLRKKAKQFKRWHQDRYYPVAAEIRHWLARYRHLDDQQILDLGFKLADAQELVAAQAGFESWAALKKGLTEMSATDQRKSASQPTLLDAQPQLFVDDIQAACDFYSQKLGFTIAFTYGEPPFYAQVVRGAARLNLRHVDMPAFHPELRQRERDILSATITLDDVKALFLEYTANSVPFHQPLRLEPWGARTFIVCDPDGNLIAFAG